VSDDKKEGETYRRRYCEEVLRDGRMEIGNRLVQKRRGRNVARRKGRLD